MCHVLSNKHWECDRLIWIVQAEHPQLQNTLRLISVTGNELDAFCIVCRHLLCWKLCICSYMGKSLSCLRPSSKLYPASQLSPGSKWIMTSAGSGADALQHVILKSLIVLLTESREQGCDNFQASSKQRKDTSLWWLHDSWSFISSVIWRLSDLLCVLLQPVYDLLCPMANLFLISDSVVISTDFVLWSGTCTCLPATQLINEH